MRCRRLASSPIPLNIHKNDVPYMRCILLFLWLEWCSTVNTLNARLDAKNIATLLRHFESKVIVIYDIDSPTGVRLVKPVYLWSLPMFHSDMWIFTWGVATRGGTNVCMNNNTTYDIYRSITSHKVTHMCCIPIIFNILLEAKPHEPSEVTSQVQVLTGGNFKARKGIIILTLTDFDVKNIEIMESVPHYCKTMGEIVLHGSSIMKRYLKDPEATSNAFKKGWFITGDMGVIHTDGYLEINDKSKDVIISGGENISSDELESVLYRHPRVLEAAVVAMPHPRCGESL
ncbi:butyrate--CoA ligase AAE11, peroxisomal-like [Hibiscus syriacus]|uniref:Butyrate--CoA ligase AAE11, peroxisomal-like n=1 Tax=Hibiscus syriacus TaxID=106335 RepID=A0A6A2WAC2_HIBSY|nr:butyrate--CoA ligase AAE11, peroxisomal-like [Hibiscus syriacus]